MERKANEILVKTSGNEVLIIQQSNASESESIRLTPEQVQLVNSWLTEARDEIQAELELTPGTSSIADLAAEFVEDFGNVFGNDWEFTKANLADESRTEFIKDDSTFILPGVDDIGNNWKNRASLLSALWALKRRLEQAGYDFLF